jgi:hypothetical protein
VPDVGFDDAGHQFQRRALAGSVAPDDAHRAAHGHGHRQVGQRRERLVRPQIAGQAALQEGALQRGEVPPIVAAVDLADAGELDGVHTTSA